MNERQSFNHKLIGQIYDAAIEPSLWPELLYALSENLDEFSRSAVARPKIRYESSSGSVYTAFDNTSTDSGTNALEFIRTHLGKALAISEKLESSSQINNSYKSIFDKLPIAAFIIDQQFSVVAKNSLADAFLANHAIFGLQGKVVNINNVSIKSELLRSFAELSQAENSFSVSIRLPDYYDTQPVSLLLSSAPTDSLGSESRQFLILVASPVVSEKISHELIMELYGLTKRESEVVIDLVSSMTLSEIAQKNNLSVNTIRTQIKSIFSKTGTNRQADLVRLILTSPYLIAQLTETNDTASTRLKPQAHKQGSIVLSDKRTLGYCEYGDPDGEPVLVFHPSTGSRLQSHPNDDIARSLGARIIIPDRPGFGISSPLEDRKLLDWPNDVEQLSAQLRIDRFSVIGFCGGGPYALACANTLAAKLKHVSVVSGVTPYENIHLLHGVSTINKVLVKVATVLPTSIYNVVTIMMRGLINDPSRYLDQLHGNLCRTDSEALSEPEFIENFISSLGEAFKQGPRAFSDEQILFSQAWDFSPQQIKIPVTLWHGEKDHHVSVEHAKSLSQELPDCQSFILPNYGHFMIYHRWRDILSYHLSQFN